MDRSTPSSRSGSTSSRSGSTRVETDSFGPIEVAADRYWGAQTERSRQNFRIGRDRMPMPIIRALAIGKLAAAETNRELGLLAQRRARALVPATGPLGGEPGPNQPVHPNDHVNMSQSSNDPFPSPLHIGCFERIVPDLIP